MDIDIRELDADRFDQLSRMLAVAFGEEITGEQVERERFLFQPGRSLGAFDDESLVGGAISARQEISVPGGAVPVAAVTGVGVVPSHRRRGVMTALMRRQLDDIHQRTAEPVAALWASEGAIYQRFGYGLATLSAGFRIDRARAGLVDAPSAQGTIRLVERDEALRRDPSIYDRIRTQRPGMLDRTGDWWRYLFSDPKEERHGWTPYFHAVHHGSDGDDGYLVYRVKERIRSGAFENEVEVIELMAASDRAYDALWRFVLDLDLTGTIRGERRPPDEPLLHMLAEPRRLSFRLADGIWVRLVDVRRALEERRYAAEGRMVLEVRDQACPWNEGRYELVAGPDRAACEPTAAQPDLVLGARDLGAAYLGGTSFATLARAGRLVEATDGSAARADAMFRWQPAPWSPHVF
jgi:predicted acetyltransferase